MNLVSALLYAALIPVIAANIVSSFPSRQVILFDHSAEQADTPTILSLRGPALAMWNTDRKAIRILSNPAGSTDPGELREVPFDSLDTQRISRREPVVTREISTSLQQDGYHVIVRAETEPQLHNEAEIVFPQGRNILYEVAIDVSTDRMSWEEISRDYVFRTVDSTGFTAEEKLRVSYPEHGKAYTRFRILHAGTGDVLPRSVQLSRFNTVFYDRYEVSPSFDAQYDEEHKMTRLLIDLEAGGNVVDTVTLTTPDTNFNRRVVLLAGVSKDATRRITTDRIFKIDTPKFQGRHLSLSVPDIKDPFLQINIFHEDDEPITVSGVSVSGPEQQLVFLAAPGNDYALYMGSDITAIPQYDLGHLLEYFDFDIAVSTRLADMETNPYYAEPEPPVLPLHERMPWLLPFVLSLIVLFLGALGVLALFKGRNASQIV